MRLHVIILSKHLDMNTEMALACEGRRIQQAAISECLGIKAFSEPVPVHVLHKHNTDCLELIRANRRAITD